MVAAGLDRDEAAHPGQEAGGDRRRGCRHDVTHHHLVFIGKCGSAIFVGIADDLGDLGHGREAVGIELGRAAGDDDPRVRALAMRAADRLAGLAHRLVGDRAAVDDDRILAGERRASPRSRRSSAGNRG